MAKEVKTTDDKVREAAAACPDARVVLEKLFPDVFTRVKIYTGIVTILLDGTSLGASMRGSGNFTQRGIFLPTRISHEKRWINWIIVTDDAGEQVAVPEVIK